MTGLIILAAGGSSRLGFPKQTLLYKGKTLIEIAIEAGLKSRCSPVNVVLGAYFENIEKGIKAYAVNIIYNPVWTEGIASSIGLAIENLRGTGEVESVVIMLCDQPFVTSKTIDNLLFKQQETGKKIVACTYQNTAGVPVLFHKSLFGELLLLKGREGAKQLLNDHPNDIATIPFEKGGIDIDTLADYEELIKNA